jgi:hypothetical protein
LDLGITEHGEHDEMERAGLERVKVEDEIIEL